MWYEDKIMRTLRCRTVQKPGALGRLLTAIGDNGGLTGKIKTVSMSSTHVVRDIVIFADSESHMNDLIQAVRDSPEAALLEIRDEVMEMHHRKVAQAVARVALERGLNRDDLNGYFD